MICVITPSAAEAMRRHAAEEYPREACGLLVGRDGTTERRVEWVVAARNDAREDHRYTIAPEDFLKAECQARRHGLDVLGFYHSHPDAEPTPSRTDERESWPTYTYLIVGVSALRAGPIHGYRRVGATFEPERVRVRDPRGAES